MIDYKKNCYSIKILCSLCFLFFFPFLNICFSDDSGFIKCIAHRGVHLSETENSLRSIILARKNKIDGVEFDVRHTQDGVPILLHDSSLKRTAKSKQNKKCQLETEISQLSYSDIKDNCMLQNGEDIPSLYEALLVLKNANMYIFVELKDMPTPETISFMSLYIKSFDKLRIISFSKEYLTMVSQTSLYNVHFVKLLYLTILSIDDATMFDGIDIKYDFNPIAEVIEKYRGLNKEIGVWTVDKYSTIKEYIKWGVDYITTNEPFLCMSAKKE